MSMACSGTARDQGYGEAGLKVGGRNSRIILQKQAGLALLRGFVKSYQGVWQGVVTNNLGQ